MAVAVGSTVFSIGVCYGSAARDSNSLPELQLCWALNRRQKAGTRLSSSKAGKRRMTSITHPVSMFVLLVAVSFAGNPDFPK